MKPKRTQAQIEEHIARLDARAADEMQQPASKWRQNALDLLAAQRREAVRELETS